MGRIWRRARMWYWQDRHIKLTCLLKARDESMVASSSLILSDMGMGEQLTSTWVMISIDLLRGWVPMRMVSDFSGFKARPLWKNQEMRCTSAVSRRLTRSGELLFDKEMKAWVPSAYCCWSTLNWLVTNWMGEMKEVNRMVQEPNLEERLFWAGLWRRHPDQISRIGPSEPH